MKTTDPFARPAGRDPVARLLAAVPDRQRPQVRTLLTNPRVGGRGLRARVGMPGLDPRPLPAPFPGVLVDVYLTDGEAGPLRDGERCGLPVPVRAGWRSGHEPGPDRVSFPARPSCGGTTGPHADWSRPGGGGR